MQNEQPESPKVAEAKVLRFGHCPSCGATDTVVARLARSAKDRGLASEDWDPCMNVIQGIVAQPQKALLVGQAMPAYIIRTDVCCKCGAMYALDIQLTTAQQTVQAPKQPLQLVPNGHHK